MLSHKIYKKEDAVSLICIHGFLGHKEDFSQLVDCLKQSYQILTIDLPGFGSSKEIYPLSLFSIHLEILFLMKTYQIEQAVIIGYSMGGRIAAHFAAHYPSYVKSLILLSTALSVEDYLKRSDQTTLWIKILKESTLENFILKWYSQPLFEGITTQTIEKRKKNKKENVLQYLSELCPTKEMADISYLQRLKNGLFFYGERDEKYKKLAKNYSSLLPRWQFSGIKNASHAVLENNSAEISEKVLKFLGDINEHNSYT